MRFVDFGAYYLEGKLFGNNSLAFSLVISSSSVKLDIERAERVHLVSIRDTSLAVLLKRHKPKPLVK